jgi:hypothetical protein
MPPTLQKSWCGSHPVKKDERPAAFRKDTGTGPERVKDLWGFPSSYDAAEVRIAYPAWRSAQGTAPDRAFLE